MRILLALLLLIMAFQVSFGQEKPKAELADEFDSNVSDCDMRSRVDNVLFSVMPENSKALFVIYDNNEYPAEKYIIERWVSYYLVTRNVTTEKYSIVFAQNTEKPDKNFLRFYKIPQNAEMPDFVEMPKDFKLSNFSKEQHLASSAGEMFDILFDTKLFANLLKNNPNLVGKIVVYENNKINRNKRITKIFRELAYKNKIPKNQIKIFYSKNEDEFPNDTYSLIPKDKSD